LWSEHSGEEIASALVNVLHWTATEEKIFVSYGRLAMAEGAISRERKETGRMGEI
jgi:hypothetical protein